MGAKTVMTMALRNPDSCADIIAVDNAPVDAALASEFPRYVEGMRKVEEAKCKSQKEADQILEPYAKVRKFPTQFSNKSLCVRSQQFVFSQRAVSV